MLILLRLIKAYTGSPTKGIFLSTRRVHFPSRAKTVLDFRHGRHFHKKPDRIERFCYLKGGPVSSVGVCSKTAKQPQYEGLGGFFSLSRHEHFVRHVFVKWRAACEPRSRVLGPSAVRHSAHAQCDVNTIIVDGRSNISEFSRSWILTASEWIHTTMNPEGMCIIPFFKIDSGVNNSSAIHGLITVLVARLQSHVTELC